MIDKTGLFGAVQQRQVRAAAVALVDSRVHVKVNSGPRAAVPAGKTDGFRRGRTCMVPTAPEADMPCRVYDHLGQNSNGRDHFFQSLSSSWPRAPTLRTTLATCHGQVSLQGHTLPLSVCSRSEFGCLSALIGCCVCCVCRDEPAVAPSGRTQASRSFAGPHLGSLAAPWPVMVQG